MKIFVTGSSGFIGKSFIKEASKKNNFIFSLSRKKQKKFNSKVKNLCGKLEDDWSKYLKKNRCSSSSCSSWSSVKSSKTKRNI